MALHINWNSDILLLKRLTPYFAAEQYWSYDGNSPVAHIESRMKLRDGIEVRFDRSLKAVSKESCDVPLLP
jgi:hypothetical protein